MHTTAKACCKPLLFCFIEFKETKVYVKPMLVAVASHRLFKEAQIEPYHKSKKKQKAV
jgi:hypothetical protein